MLRLNTQRLKRESISSSGFNRAACESQSRNNSVISTSSDDSRVGCPFSEGKRICTLCKIDIDVSRSGREDNRVIGGVLSFSVPFDGGVSDSVTEGQKVDPLPPTKVELVTVPVREKRSSP